MYTHHHHGRPLELTDLKSVKNALMANLRGENESYKNYNPVNLPDIWIIWKSKPQDNRFREGRTRVSILRLPCVISPTCNNIKNNTINQQKINRGENESKIIHLLSCEISPTTKNQNTQNHKQCSLIKRGEPPHIIPDLLSCESPFCHYNKALSQNGQKTANHKIHNLLNFTKIIKCAKCKMVKKSKCTNYKTRFCH